MTGYRADPPENCHLTIKKLPKTWYFFPPKMTNFFIFFQKNCHWHFFWKKLKFLSIFLNNCQVFGNFLTVKWQFSGGSGIGAKWGSRVQPESGTILHGKADVKIVTWNNSRHKCPMFSLRWYFFYQRYALYKYFHTLVILFLI